MKSILIINGPNLNLLGKREIDQYGKKSLETIAQELNKVFSGRAQLEFFQSNHEGAIIDKIHQLEDYLGLVINPAALTHTSYAIRDALVAIDIPTVEVHISNVYARDAFRRHSLISEVCLGVIAGCGHLGYHLAVEALLQHKKS